MDGTKQHFVRITLFLHETSSAVRRECYSSGMYRPLEIIDDFSP